MTARPPRPDPERVREAVSALTPIQREVLMLSAAERLSNEEIGARLGISHEAVARHLANAVCDIDRALRPPGRRWWQRR